jgi:membrane fusion protein (multidrug efflux system)
MKNAIARDQLGPARLSAALLGAALLGMTMVGCSKPAGAEQETAVQAPVAVEVLTVQPSDFVEYGEYYGKVAALEEKTLVSAAGGTVEAIAAREGDLVAKGQSLGRVDSARIRTAYEVALLNERIARENHARQQQFLADGNASRLAVDQAELAWLNSRSALLEAEKMREGAMCITPIGGVVTSRFLELHQELPPGSRTFTVARLDQVRIGIGIPEQEIGGVAIGNEAEVSIAMVPGRSWQGTLARVSREVSAETLTFQAEVLVDNPDRAILAGITAKVRLKRHSLRNQIAVPSQAILTSGEQTYVMVEKDSRAQKVPVVPGPTDSTRTVILRGLAAGARLITEGNHLVQDGSAVKVKNQG